MLFLETQIGSLAANAIVLIGGLNTRPTGNYHEILYTHGGGEARETRATEEAVQDFHLANEALT
jgi:hypothetical protein